MSLSEHAFSLACYGLPRAPMTLRGPLAISPNFLHFVGLELCRGRHPGLPWGVAGVTSRST
jgi:hypothetical protein